MLQNVLLLAAWWYTVPWWQDPAKHGSISWMVEVIQDNFDLRHFNKVTWNVLASTGWLPLKLTSGIFAKFRRHIRVSFKRRGSVLLLWLAWLLTSWLPWLPIVAMVVLFYWGRLFANHLTAWCEVVEFRTSARRVLLFSVIYWTFRYVVQTQGSLSLELWCDGVLSGCWLKWRCGTILEQFDVEFCDWFCNAGWLL